MESLGTGVTGGQASALTKEANLAQTKGANQAQTEGANLALAGGANLALAGENEAGSIGMTAKREKEMGSLGMVIKGFKMGCNKAYWRIYGMNTAPRKGLFELGYNDKVLLHERQLEGWKKYLDDNPRRLMVKRMTPGLFTVMQNKEVVGRETDSTPIVPILHKDHWKEWEPTLPLFPMTEEFLCVEDATMMMIDILRHETLTSDEEEELQEYTETLITMGKTQVVAAVRITPRAAEIPKAAEPPAVMRATVWSKRTPRKTE